MFLRGFREVHFCQERRPGIDIFHYAVAVVGRTLFHLQVRRSIRVPSATRRRLCFHLSGIAPRLRHLHVQSRHDDSRVADTHAAASCPSHHHGGGSAEDRPRPRGGFRDRRAERDRAAAACLELTVRKDGVRTVQGVDVGASTAPDPVEGCPRGRRSAGVRGGGGGHADSAFRRLARGGRESDQGRRKQTRSISTSAPRPRAATPIVVRLGKGCVSGKNLAYTELNAAKSRSNSFR